MKKYILASLLAVGLSIPVSAIPGSDLVPGDSKGSVTLPDYAGVSVCRIDASTGTNAVLCDTGKGIILDVIASSVAATDPLVFRDSATANTTSAVLYVFDGNMLGKAKLFPRYNNGLSLNAKVAPGASNTACHPSWTVIYRALD